MFSSHGGTPKTLHISVLLLCAFSVGPLSASHRSAPKLADNVDLPGTYDFDLSLGAKQRSEILGRGPEVTDDSGARVGLEVFNRLLTAEMNSGVRLPYHWNFAEVSAPIVNASSTADGQIVAYAGLAKLIGSSPGLWAAVLSHEITHTARRHIVRQALFHMYIQEQLDYWERKQRFGDKGAGWVVLGIKVAGPLAEKKLSRSLEHEADVQGMLLMARAGYHPDYVFALHHLLRIDTGEQSKFAAFFSDHPRWATRDQRNDKAYTEAVAEYARLWPDEAASPGGDPPALAFLADTRVSENKQRQTTDIALALSCRNISSPVMLHLRFTDKNGHSLPAPAVQYADSAGNLDVLRPAVCADKDDAFTTTIHIPPSFGGRQRKLRARVDVIASDGRLLERSKQVELHLPNANRNGNTPVAVEVDPPVSSDAMARVADFTARAHERTFDGNPNAYANTAVSSISPASTATLEPRNPDHDTLAQRLALDSKDVRRDAWSGSDDPEIRHTQQLISTWWPSPVQEHSHEVVAVQQLQPSSDRMLILSTSTLTFPHQQIHSPSAPATVTINNAGSSPFEISNIRMTGANGEDFSASQTCGGTIAAGSSCTLTVRFTPEGYGQRKAAIAVYDQGGRPQIVLLEGIGIR